jgi:hypothetical protein
MRPCESSVHAVRTHRRSPSICGFRFASLCRLRALVQFMMNMKLCNTLAYSGFDPKAEAKKQVHHTAQRTAHTRSMQRTAGKHARCNATRSGSAPCTPRSVWHATRSRQRTSAGAVSLCRGCPGAVCGRVRTRCSAAGACSRCNMQRTVPAEQSMRHIVPAAVRLSTRTLSTTDSYIHSKARNMARPCCHAASGAALSDGGERYAVTSWISRTLVSAERASVSCLRPIILFSARPLPA